MMKPRLNLFFQTTTELYSYRQDLEHPVSGPLEQVSGLARVGTVVYAA